MAFLKALGRVAKGALGGMSGGTGMLGGALGGALGGGKGAATGGVMGKVAGAIGGRSPMQGGPMQSKGMKTKRSISRPIGGKRY